MTQNIGSVDRIIRIVLGLVIAALGIIFHSWWGLVAIIPLGTALFGTCLIYLPFGMSTKPKAASEPQPESPPEPPAE